MPTCIDGHNHFFPKQYITEFDRQRDRFWVKGAYRPIDERSYDLESRLQEMEKIGIDKAILSLGPPGVDPVDEITESIALAQMVNDEIARSCQENDHFLGLATLPLQDPNASVVELDRAVNDLSLKGAMIFSNVGGKYLDSEDFFPVYERAEKLGIPLYIHPTLPYGLESMIDYGLYVTVGYLFDSSLSVLRLIHAAVLDKFPSLKLVISQLGGTLPYLIGRIDVQWKTLAVKVGSKISSPPSSYLKRMYIDTVSNYTPAYECASALLPYERMLFGSDFPFGDMGKSKSAIESLKISDDEKRRVFAETSTKLFHIE